MPITKRLQKYQIGWTILLSCTVTLLFLVPHLAAQAIVNWGDLVLLHTVMQRTNSSERYSLWRSDNNEAKKAQQVFATVSRFMSPDTNWEWRRGRVALASGQTADAVRILTVEKALSEPFNAIRFLNTLEAHSRAGNDAGVIALYQSYLTYPFLTDAQLISDTVALAYLNQARTQIDAGHLELARPLLHQVIKLRPFDLYASYWLWRSSSRSSNEAQVYFKRFFYFTAAAVDPQPDERFLEHFFSMFPYILAEDQWGEARSINLISYWVWQHPSWPALGELLDFLTAHFPGRSIWPQLQGERYHRLNKLDLAATYYRIALSREPENKLAEIQLANLANTHTQFHRELISDQALAAQILGIPHNAVELKVSLHSTTTVPVINFNLVGGATDWPFVEGPDPFASTSSMRILNLWWPETDPVSNFTPYAEYHSESFSVNTEWVMISVLFRVDGDTNRFGFLGVGSKQSPNWQPYLTNVNLLDTTKQWQRVVIVARTPLLNNQWFALLRNWGAASAWYSQLTIYSIKFTYIPNSCVENTCVYFQPVVLE